MLTVIFMDYGKNNEAIKIGGELYYIQSAKERLQDMVDKICK